MQKLLTILLFLSISGYAQKDSIVAQRFYGSGKSKHTKSIAWYKGVDTVLVLKYYKNEKLKDSAWVTIKNDKEFYFGTQRTFYKTGKLASVTYFKNGRDEYTGSIYRENGQLQAEIKKPGERKFYNKKGEVIRQLDVNSDKQVFVPKKYKNQKHLLNTSYSSRIKFTKAFLTNEKENSKINSGALISIILNGDTTPMQHYQIEGYSADSIYLSKFEYNSNIKKDALQYENTVALALNQIKTIHYSKNYTRKKYNRANAATLGGLDLTIIPLVALPFSATSFGLLAPVFGGCIVIGIPVYYWGKHLYKKMVPKKYEMDRWKIKIKT